MCKFTHGANPGIAVDLALLKVLLSVRLYVKGHFVDPLSPNLHTEGNFQARFSRRKSIQCSTLYRLTSIFFALRKYFYV